jgi:hypothetical protein
VARNTTSVGPIGAETRPGITPRGRRGITSRSVRQRREKPTSAEFWRRALPVYVLEANTTIQMQASLTSVFSLEVDPREAALLETEEAIGMVVRQSQAVELAPQSAYIRRLQHQMAERANLVSRSRGREPYRRVRVYPDEARGWR